MLRHLPNLLTLLRIALVPLLALRILQHDYDAALAITFIAAITDALDGLLARRFGWQSRLGGILDPLADKLMLTVAFISLAWVGAIPVWLTALVIVRDLVIVIGGTGYHYLIGRFELSPSRLSKLTTVVQILLALISLIGLAGVWPVPGWLAVGLVAITALLTPLSGLHYVARWGSRARHEWQLRRSHRKSKT